MAEENILTGGLNKLQEIISDVTEYEANIEKQEELGGEIKKLTKDTENAEAALEDEINEKVQAGEDAVCAGFTKSIEGDRDRLKVVQTEREKAKSAGIKERITNETAYLKQENSNLLAEKKEKFAKNRVPKYCSSSLYYALIYAREARNIFHYVIVMLILFLAIPGTMYLFAPKFLPGWLPVIYDFVMAVVYISVTRQIAAHTLGENQEIIEEGRRIKLKIRDNKAKMRRIAKGIKTDKNEEMYGLEEYDNKINDITEEIKRIEAKRQVAMSDFQKNTKPDIIAEIEGRERDTINAMKTELTAKTEESSKLEELIKQQRIYISTNYEAYLGKDYADPDKLKELELIMKEEGANTIAQALAIYQAK